MREMRMGLESRVTCAAFYLIGVASSRASVAIPQAFAESHGLGRSLLVSSCYLALLLIGDGRLILLYIFSSLLCSITHKTLILIS